jgi:hypothetical protein
MQIAACVQPEGSSAKLQRRHHQTLLTNPFVSETLIDPNNEGRRDAATAQHNKACSAASKEARHMCSLSAVHALTVTEPKIAARLVYFIRTRPQPLTPQPRVEVEEQTGLTGSTSRVRVLLGTEGASSLSSVFTLCNSAIGAGVLSLPYAFQCAGDK